MKTYRIQVIQRIDEVHMVDVLADSEEDAMDKYCDVELGSHTFQKYKGGVVGEEAFVFDIIENDVSACE